MPNIESISPFALKGGIIKTDDFIHGVVFKGVDKNFNWKTFDDYLIKGEILQLNDSSTQKEVIISKLIADKLQLDTGMSIVIYFIQEPPRLDKFKIRGIYQSGFEDFDDRFVFADIKKIQQLNKWDSDDYAGYEIMLSEYENIENITTQVYRELPYDLKAKNVKDRFPFIMEWLGLLDTNVYFIIGLMIIISGITMISTLLILILERTNMIGILKAVGMPEKSIRKIFIYQAVNIILKGLFFGNLIGLGLLALQYYLEFIPLNPETYYLNTVPVVFNWLYFVILNIGTIVLVSFMMLWPSTIISRIKPIKAIKFN
jgi:lipoprotein-releasing system permease protein